MIYERSYELELHTLLDDGEPHCSCGESFRGQHYNKFTDHALGALRASLNVEFTRAEAWRKKYIGLHA